jgi:nicotinamidase-related amidase
MNHVRLALRYYRRYTDPGVERKEVNCNFAEVEWDMPLTETALVCLDVWDQDIHQDMSAIDNQITVERIVPVVAACRQHGMQVVHAPASPIAERSKNWVNLIKNVPTGTDQGQVSMWPPAEFRSKTGKYARYARPFEPQREGDNRLMDAVDFHPLVRPQAHEAVVQTGEELHRWCQQQGVLHLFYVGFHTPGCMTRRSYGIPQMLGYGYSCILLRDCTNGMETHETFPEKICRRGTIAFLEEMGVYTILSDQFILQLQNKGEAL